jgi:NTE family protein
MNMHVGIKTGTKRAQRRNVVKRPLNLALQGAGAHGAFGWGVLDKLVEDGRVDIAGLAATSAGAMNAMVFAYGERKGDKDEGRAQLEAFWRKVSDRGAWSNPLQRTPLDRLFGAAEPWAWRWFDGMTHALSPYDFNPLNLSPMRAVLESFIDFAEWHRATSATHVTICATNVRTGRPRAFAGREITVDAVLAAACQPNLSQAVEIDGEHYWDGVYSGLPSLRPLAARSGVPDILVAQIGSLERRTLPRRAADIQARTTEIALNASLQREMRALATATQLRVHAIHSGATLSDATLASKCDTSWTTLTKLRDAGRLAAELWLETHFDRIGVASTIDLDANDL